MAEWHQKLRQVWLPLSPRGVAALARADDARLWAVLLVVAAGAAVVVVWFLCACWTPVISEAVRRLPERAALRNGLLDWEADSPARLGENKWLAVAVDARESGTTGPVADLEITLGGRSLSFTSLLGSLRLKYSRTWSLSLARNDWLPWWGAWRWPLLALTAGLTVLTLLPLWGLLASLYCAIPHAVALYADRPLSWAEAWRLSAAALMPGACLLMVGLAGYGLGFLDLIHLAACFGLHLVTGWLLLLLSPFFLPKSGGATRNPFATPQVQPEPKGSNPFAG